MRRKDREITQIDEKLALLKKCKVCRIGLSLHDEPYIVPLNFGYSFADNILTLYFHSAVEGKKIDILRANPKVCFEIDADHKLIPSNGTACGYSFYYSSLIGFGNISFIENREEKIFALNALMQHQTGEDKIFNFSDAEINKVLIYKLSVTEFTGKRQ